MITLMIGNCLGGSGSCGWLPCWIGGNAMTLEEAFGPFQAIIAVGLLMTAYARKCRAYAAIGGI